jgi:hypothetical protein
MAHTNRGQKTRRADNHQAVGTCPDGECGKQAYPSRIAAKRAAVRLYPGQRIRVYKHCEWWHLTSQSAEQTAWWRDHLTSQSVRATGIPTRKKSA